MTTTNNTNNAQPMNDDDLNRIVSEIASTFGYTKASAEFTPFREFKVRWTRSYRLIHFTVSDFLKYVPEFVIEGIFQSLFSKLTDKEDTRYPMETGHWLLNEMPKVCQQMYIQRNGLKEGVYQDLDAIAKSLGIDSKIVFGYRSGISVLFNVISIENRYDVPGAEEAGLIEAILYQVGKLIEGRSLWAMNVKP